MSVEPAEIPAEQPHLPSFYPHLRCFCCSLPLLGLSPASTCPPPVLLPRIHHVSIASSLPTRAAATAGRVGDEEDSPRARCHARAEDDVGKQHLPESREKAAALRRHQHSIPLPPHGEGVPGVPSFAFPHLPMRYSGGSAEEPLSPDEGALHLLLSRGRKRNRSLRGGERSVSPARGRLGPGSSRGLCFPAPLAPA